MEDNEKNPVYLGDLMTEAIANSYDALSGLDPTSEEYAQLARIINEQVAEYTNFVKVECEYNDRQAQRDFEAEMKRFEVTQQAKNAHITTGIQCSTELAKAGLALAVFCGMYRTNLMCEFTQDKFVLNPLFKGLPNMVLRSVKIG